jgi:CheY-like chemotaxis protein
VARGPNVVLLDFNMPKKNGYGMLGRMEKELRLLRGVS